VLGLSEMRQRYRRSTLGPLWVTLSMGIQALVMGFLLAFLFRIELDRYLPFLCISLVTWHFLMTAATEGANGFIGMSGVILQVKRPLWTYIMLTLWRNSIVYAHTIVVFVIAGVAFGIRPSTTYLLVPVSLALLAANAGWIALAVGILSARFRDVPLIIQNAFTVLVWLTPVYYHPDQLPREVRVITEINPLTYILEAARAPFLNEMLTPREWAIAVAITVVGWAFTFVLFVRSRARIAYWL
jgi:ABC-type polysaccharide/polyol phosphate export permease